MSEWNNDEDFTDIPSSTDSGQRVSPNKSATGGLHVAMTISALLAAAAGAFGMAYATADVASRPYWMLGLCVAVPVAAMLLAVMITESITGRMTESYTRGRQVLVSLACTAVAFVLGMMFNVSSTIETTEEIVTEETVVTEGWSNVLIVLDKSGSMYADGRDTMATRAMQNLMDHIDDGVNVGLLIDVGWAENNEPDDIVPLSSRVVPIAPMDASHRTALKQMINHRLVVNENFPLATQTAIDMITEYTAGNPMPFTILYLSDG